jgi:four helix bundle protein
MARIESFKDLIVYRKAYLLAMEILEISKGFPKVEQYSLTDQIRRSSRSVTSCIGESWARRRYIKSFINKLVEALGENTKLKSGLIIHLIVSTSKKRLVR